MSNRINAPLSRRLRAMSLVPFLALLGLLSLFWLMGAWPSLAAPDAAIYYVTESGSGTSCSQGTPCALPTALNQAGAGDEIRMAQGTYTSGGGAPVLTVTQSITLSGGFAPPDWDNADPDLYPTYLDGENNGRVVEIQGNVSPIIQGFHIINGNIGSGGNDVGAGIHNNSGSPTIRNNRIYDNQTGNQGGGVYDGGHATIRENSIYNNEANAKGGGVAVENNGNVTTTIYANEIYSNTTAGSGGGINVIGAAILEINSVHDNSADTYAGLATDFTNSSIRLHSNLIYENDATTQGGGLSIFNNGILWNNTIAANTADSNAGGVFIGTGATVQFSNNIVALNTSSGGIDGIADSGSIVSGGYNNIIDSGDSITVTNTYTYTPGFLGAGNYHLAETSNNVDAGDPATPDFIDVDIDGQARPNDSVVDVGADEFYPNFPAFSLTPESRSDGVDRGAAFTYDHTLENEGTVADTYSFACDNTDWTVDTCPGNVSLQPGENAVVQTTIQVPGSASALDQATTIITATSAYSSDLSHRAVAVATVNPIPGVSFTPSYSETVLPGETITYTHQLTNTGDALDTFTVQLVAGDWAELLPSNSFQIEIPSGDTRDVRVRITVPPQAAAGLANETRIQASSDFDPTVTDVVTDTVTARPTVGTRYVGAGGDDTDNNCTQLDTPCLTIGHAVGQASFDDEIHIAAGTYFESGIPLNDTIHLSGGWVSGFRVQDEATATVIDAESNTRIFSVAPGSSIRPSVSNITLQNGQAGGPGGAVRIGSFAQPSFADVIFRRNQGTTGGAVYAGSNASVQIRSSQFISNTGTSNGGAVYGDDATLSLQQSSFMTNTTAVSGGALYINNGLIQAQNNLFFANQAGGDGGAVLIQDAVQATLGNNTLVENSAGGDGGAIYNDLADLTLVNDLFIDNVAGDSGGAVYQTGNGSSALSYSDVWNNSAPETVGVTDGPGNFSADPLFADAQFRLARRSPALDAGDPATTLLVDFEDDARPADQGFDVGYDELAGCRAKRDDVVYGSIQEAIDVPDAESDLIQVSGICRGVNTIQVSGQTISQTVHLTESLTIQGGWNSDFSNRTFQPTFIDPEGRGRGVYISGPVSPTLDSLTIVNGDAAGLGGGGAANNVDAGGGVYVLDSQPTLLAVSVFSSTAELGGGLYNHNGAPRFEALSGGAGADPVLTELRGNTAVSGGGFYNFNGQMTMDSVRVHANDAATGGGVYNSGPLTLANTLIYSNTAGDGAGIYNDTAQSTRFYHLTVVSNTATLNGGGFYNESGAPVIRSSIFQGNASQPNGGAAVYVAAGDADLDYNYYYAQSTGDVAGDTPGANDITSATPPGLVGPGTDFHLLDDAPAVDAADPASPITSDADGDPRPSNQGPDIGADEVVGCLVQLNGVIYGSIQAALDDAAPGDTIRVAGECSGVHQVDASGLGGSGACGDAFLATVHITKSVHLEGGWRTDFSEQDDVTYLDAQQQGRVMYIGPGITSTVSGFHILNGSVSGASGAGGGVCIDSSEPTLQHNQIYSNTADIGAAVYSVDSAALINGNHIFSNTAMADGAIYATGTGQTTTVQNNFVYLNTADNGGGFYNADGDHAFWHNTVYANSAGGAGGGIYVAAGSPPIRGNIVMSNTAATGDGAYGDTGASAQVGYNDFFGQDQDFAGSISGGGPGHLGVDPEFKNLANFNFSINITSPVADMGDPTLPITGDFELDIRPSHQGFDMGADEVGGCFARVLSAPDTIYGSAADAVAAAAAGDTVQISGVCYGVNEQDIGAIVRQSLLLDKDLTLDGDWNYEDAGSGVLDALGNGRVLYVRSGATITVTNLTLQGGAAAGGGGNPYGGNVYNAGTLLLTESAVLAGAADWGGGVYNEGFLTLDQTMVMSNTAVSGGGVYNNVVGSGEAILGGESEFSGNQADDGGAVYQDAGRLRLNGAKLYDNSATSDGGAVYLGGGTGSTLDVFNNFIYRNNAARGAGIFNQDTNGRLWHNTIFNNQGDGIYSASTAGETIHSNLIDSNSGAGLHTTAATPDIDYNNLWNNGSDYGGTAVAGPNSISAAPLYVDRFAGDYHLQEDSPGVDVADPDLNAGTITQDYDGHIRPTNQGPDIGADEINTCLIRVDDQIFGVLQEAIDYAEQNYTDPYPDIEIARGACRGVQTRNGAEQVGYISENLDIIGSLRRSDFSQPSPPDRSNPDIGANSTVIDAQGEGRALYIAPGADVYLQHIVLVNGNAAVTDVNNDGGGVYNDGGLETSEINICSNSADRGGGYFGSSNATATIRGAYSGPINSFRGCPVAVFNDNDQLIDYEKYAENVAADDGGGFYIASGSQFNIVNHGLLENVAGNRGGGLYNAGNNTIVINGVFVGNQANTGDGGSIYNANEIELYHNTIINSQTGSQGGGVYNATGSTLSVNSSIIYNNTANSGGGGIHTESGGNSDYNLFYANAPSDLMGISAGANSLFRPPQLIGFEPTRYSPAIDRADPALLTTPILEFAGIDFDADKLPRPDVAPGYPAVASDIGAFEYWKDAGCAVLPTSQEATILPGDFVTYTVEIHNVGNPSYLDNPIDSHGYTDTITITLDSQIPDWTELEGGPEQTVTLDWKDFVTRKLTVTVPTTATTGLQEQSVVRCTSEAIPDRTETANHTTNVGLVGGILITPQYIDAAQPGAVLTYTHTITNVGNQADTFEIVPNAGAQGLSTAELVGQDPGITDTVTLDVNESITRELRVTILDTAAPGEVATPGLIVRSTTADPPVEGSVLNQITILPIPGTRYVAIGGDDTANNCLVSTDPCATAQHAVDVATDGDEIRVAAGAYADAITTTVGGDQVVQVVYVDKSVDIRGGYSVNDNFAVSQPITNVTILTGENARRVLFIADGITVTVSGFFIQDGQPYAAPYADQREQFGGGIYNNGANLTISSTQVLSNSAQVGAGLYHAGGDLTLASTVFAGNDNQANAAGAFGEGAGVFIAGGDAWLENNTFVANRANIGGSLSAIRPGALALNAVNPSGNGGAIYGNNGALGLLNNIFADNQAEMGSAAYLSATTLITANYSLYFNNNSPATTFTPGPDSFTADPTFEDSLYHIGATSPAKDGGTNQDLRYINGVDFEGDPRLNSGVVDIGADERLQRPSFSFTPITLTATVDPGTPATFKHLLRNTGDADDDYSLSISNQLTPDDQPAWTYALTTTAGITQNIPLNVGEEVTVTLVITGGDPGYLNTSIITATAVRAGASSVRDTTIVSNTAGVDIESDQSDSGDPGTTVIYTHTLTNTGNGVDQFYLRPITETATPPGWTVTVEPTQTTFLAPNGSTPVTVSVSIPPGTSAATIHKIGIEATAQDPFARDALTDTTTVLASYGLALAPDNAQMVDPGGTISYTHTLTNLGNITDTISLEASGTPGDWTVTVTPTTVSSLSGGDTTPVTVTVTAPPDATGGLQHTALVTATSGGDPTQMATAVNTTTVRTIRTVAVGPDNGPVIADPGDVLTYTHTVANLGNVTDTFTLNATSDQGWLDSVTPPQVTLAPQASELMTVTLTVPAGASPGMMDTTTVTATSTTDGAVFDTAVDQTRVRQVHGVAFTPNNTFTTTAPSTVVYNHVLTNTGDGLDEFAFSASSSNGWTVTTPPNVSLDSGIPTGVAVTLTVPSGVGSITDTMLVTATSVISPATSATVTDTTIVTATQDLIAVAIGPDNEGQGIPGETVTYTHSVTNTGTVAETFNLTAGGAWATTLSAGAVTLNPGQNTQIQVGVTIPAGATPGDTDQTTVTAASSTQPAISDTAVNTTTVIPDGDVISVSIEPDNTATGAPGDTMTYNHTVTNTGTVTEIFSLTVVSDQGWPASVSPASVELAPGENGAVEVMVDIPLTAVDNQVDQTTVTATSSSQPSISDTAVNTTTVDVAGALGVAIGPPTQVALGAPGETVTYTHQVTNTGLFSDTYDLTAVSANWNANITPTSIQLSPGETAPLTVTVLIDTLAGNGDTDVTVVTATSQTEPTVLDTATDTTVAQFQGEGVLVEPDNSAIGEPGDTIRYFHTLTNTSNATHSFLLETQSSLGWTVAITPGGRVDNVEAGMTVPITVDVTIPLGANDGQEDVTTVVATALTDPNVTDLAIDRTRVRVPVYGVVVAPDNAATGLPGETLTYNHVVTNAGNVADTVTITAVSDQGWTATPSQSTLTLGAGESAPVTVDVTIPASTISGTVDTTTVTAASTTDPTAVGIAFDTTTVEEEVIEGGPIYLPIITLPGEPTGVDLIATDIQVDPATPAAGEEATVYVTIRNQGTVDVPFGNNFFLDFYVDRQPMPFLIGDIQWGVQGVLLEAGASVTYSGPYSFAGGTHQLWAQVDTDNTVAEYPYEYNNTLGPEPITVTGQQQQSEQAPPQPQPSYGPRPTATPGP